jgi:hypothetical protein
MEPKFVGISQGQTRLISFIARQTKDMSLDMYHK